MTEDHTAAVSLFRAAQAAGKICNEASISEFELCDLLDRAGLNLPSCCCAWYGISNGFSLLFTDFFGVGHGAAVDALEIYRSPYCGFENRLLWPLGSDGGGNYYVIDLNVRMEAAGCPVLFSEGSANWGITSIVASSVDRFFWFALENERCDGLKWPCDRGYVTTHDPLIESCGYPLPWGRTN